MAKIAPSILSANFARLGDDVLDVCSRGIDFLHIDVMDGMFVPNISFGPDVMKSLNDVATVPYDVHLMVEEPIRYTQQFVTENTEYITVHYEACKDLLSTIKQIKTLGVKVGVSIKPNTHVHVLDDYLDIIDLVLVMSVEPGFGGQKFMDISIPKIEYFKEQREKRKLGYQIEIDGGICVENAEKVKDAGVDIIVAGSAVFKSEDRTYTISNIKK